MSQGRALVVAVILAVAGIAAGSEEEALRWGHHHHGHRPRHPRSSSVPPATPSPTPFVPTPTPPAPTPTPPAPPAEPCSCCELCRIAPDPFMAGPGEGTSPAVPALPVPSSPRSPPVPVAPPAPVNCVTELAVLAPCSAYLTGRAVPPPTPQSGCCTGLAAFVAAARAAGPVGGGQRVRCLCPILHGDVNAFLAKPVDTVRVLYLPLACGLALPPETVPICFGQHSMPTVANLTSEFVLH